MSEAIRPGIYRHFKGNRYRVLFTARHSETEEELVVYQALYGEGGYWVRPAAMWSAISWKRPPPGRNWPPGRNVFP